MGNEIQDATFEAIIQKIRERLLLPGNTQSGVADLLGLDKATIGRWLKSQRRGRRKTIDELIFYMKALGMNPDEYLGFSPESQATLRKIPLIGMAACGYEWFRGVKLPIAAASAPAGDESPNMFAVLASGESMQPIGIQEGFIVFCDPDSPAEKDDVVYIERENGTMSLKMYRGVDGIWTILEGWLPPDGSGAQQIYTLREKTTNITKIAPAIFIKRKL